MSNFKVLDCNAKENNDIISTAISYINSMSNEEKEAVGSAYAEQEKWLSLILGCLPNDSIFIIKGYLSEFEGNCRCIAEEVDEGRILWRKKYFYVLAQEFYSYMDKLYADKQYFTGMDEFTISPEIAKSFDKTEWLSKVTDEIAYVKKNIKKNQIGKIMNGVVSLLILSTNISWK